MFPIFAKAQMCIRDRNMVKEVKKRGPFLNMSDFVNRRLQSGEMGVKGALQAPLHGRIPAPSRPRGGGWPRHPAQG